MTVFHSGQRVTQGEASIGATLNTVVRSTTKDGSSLAESPHSPHSWDVADTPLVIRILSKKEVSLPITPQGNPWSIVLCDDRDRRRCSAIPVHIQAMVGTTILIYIAVAWNVTI